ncbi:YhbY-like protein [Dioscorea alata]|uniref:YhbY-like protein n=2 Tax=Dioscorea alata TaxID=55571 RepID=A0ACB7WGQ4_DIOAL|nr:YhbY-like protein [Dioscorea alata]KAH7686940.1 YhbY-like protein [Dioscorea alata]
MAAAALVLGFRLPVTIFSSLRSLRSSSSLPLASPRLSFRSFCSNASSSALTSSSPLSTGLLRDSNEDEEVPGSQILETEPQPEPEPVLVCASSPPPKLSVKEKKELASYAHSLGKKLKSQQVGKSGVTPSVAASFIETLEANELLKLKVHGSCPGELSEVISQLENATGSVAVGQIGRTVILYRPSISKMKKREAEITRLNSKPREFDTAYSRPQKRGQFRRASSQHLSEAA